MGVTSLYNNPSDGVSTSIIWTSNPLNETCNNWDNDNNDKLKLFSEIVTYCASLLKAASAS